MFSLGEKLHCLLKRSQVWKAAFFEADSLGLEGQSPLHEHKQVANTHNLVRVFIQLEKKKMERSRNRRQPAKKGWANFYQVRGTVCCKSQQDSCCDPEDVGGVAVDLDDFHHHFRRLTGLKDLFFSFCLFCFVLLFSREKREGDTYCGSGLAKVAKVLKDLEGELQDLVMHCAAVASPDQLENDWNDLVAHQSFAANLRKAGGCFCVDSLCSCLLGFESVETSVSTYQGSHKRSSPGSDWSWSARFQGPFWSCFQEFPPSCCEPRKKQTV